MKVIRTMKQDEVMFVNKIIKSRYFDQKQFSSDYDGSISSAQYWWQLSEFLSKIEQLWISLPESTMFLQDNSNSKTFLTFFITLWEILVLKSDQLSWLPQLREFLNKFEVSLQNLKKLQKIQETFRYNIVDLNLSQNLWLVQFSGKWKSWKFNDT